MPDEIQQTIRLDKWLKVARIFKTRSAAAMTCESHHVRVNDQTAKPSKMIKVGDTITIKMGHRYRSFEVLGISQKSVSPAQAKELYREQKPELTPEVEEQLRFYREWERMAHRKGRPTKKERREIERRRGY